MSAPNPPRARLIGAVHASAARAGLDDEARRDLMERMTGKRSAKDMTIAELGCVLDHLNGKKSTFKSGGAPADAGYTWRKKVKALWISAGQLGLVKDPSDRALDHFVKRQAGVDALAFLSAGQAKSVIEALKSWLARPIEEGGGAVKWSTRPDADDRKAVARALWARLGAAGAVLNAPGPCEDYCRVSIGIWQRRSLTPEEWGRALPVLAEMMKKIEGRQA